MKKLALLALLVTTVGCGETKSVLDEGVGTRAPARVVDSAAALEAGRTTLAHWRSELRKGTRQNPGQRFANLSPNELRARLYEQASRYGFEVVSLDLLRPVQLAPQVVVRTSDYLALAQATHAILDQIDPKALTADDRTGWRFEGFYFRAEDEHGVPFLITYNFMREEGPGGGQWARSERLFPFPHG